MSADVADRLRALARDHLEGRSSLESYRRLRAPLLDRLIAPADGGSFEATQPRASIPLAEVTQPRAVVARAAVEPSRPLLPGGSAVMLRRVVACGAVALLVIFAAVFLVRQHRARSLAAPRTATAGSGGMSAGGAEQAEPIRALLEPLLENPDWSDARLLALNEALLEAGRVRLEAARSTDWFNDFVDSVRSRLLQQQALAGTPLTPDSSPLAALAVTLGIDLTAPAQPARSSTPLPGGAHAQAVRSSAEGAKRAGPAKEATGAGSSSRVESRSSLAPTQVSRPAAAQVASPALRDTHYTEPVQAEEGGSQAADAAPASAPMTLQHATATASARHAYPACSAALSQARLNYCQDLLASGDPAPLLVVIPAGSFLMGNGGLAQEAPAHRVILAHDFAMSVYEVSQSEFQLYCRSAGKACPQQPWTRGDYPVVNVSWQDAQDYARWLSAATRERYRLPTEAEWEYAARAGTDGLYPSGDSLSPTDAYFSIGAPLSAPAPRSMRFNANAWHLMHMIGNAREWVQDAWSPGFSGAPVDGSARLQGEPGIKVVRGGCYADAAIKLRLTRREPLPADTRDRCTGIRLVREIP